MIASLAIMRVVVAVIWVDAEGVVPPGGGSGDVTRYAIQSPFVGNGLASDDIDTNPVCRVTLVGTNEVAVTSFLGLTEFPAEAEQWWKFYDKRTNNPSALTGNEGAEAAAAHATDLDGATVTLSTGLSTISAPDLTINIPTIFGTKTIDCNPMNNSAFALAISCFRAFILAIVGVSVGFLIMRDWQKVTSRVQQAQQAQGFGVDVLGNNAPMLFAQINAGIITLIISAALIILTAAAVALAATWLTSCLSGIDTSGVNGIAIYLFQQFVPLAGLVTVGAVYLGWLATGAVSEYLVRIAVRHTTA